MMENTIIMAEKMSKDDQIPSPVRAPSKSAGVVIPVAREPQDIRVTSANSGSVSPKLPISKIFR